MPVNPSLLNVPKNHPLVSDIPSTSTPNLFNPGSGSIAPVQPVQSPQPEKIALSDPRTVSLATGAKINPGQASGSFDANRIKDIIKASKHVGIDPNTALAVALQETHIGNKNPENVGNVYAGYGKAPNGLNQQAYELAAFLKEKMDEGKKLGFKDEAHILQMYNGMGKLKSNLMVNGKQQPSRYYGLLVKPGESIDMRQNPLYGKTIQDLRDNVIKKNPKIQALLSGA